MKRLQPVFHPLLFALFPILFLYARNAREMWLESILVPLLLAICFAVAATVLLGLLLKNFKKSGLIASLAILLFFSYGHILNILPKFSIPLGQFTIDTGFILIIFWGLLLLAALVFILRTRSNLWPFTKILNAVSAGLVIIQVISAGFILVSRPSNSEIVRATEQEEKAEEVSPPVAEYDPDIYYIIMDAFGGTEILKRIYNVDNSAFMGFLQLKGFYVNKQAWSNYCQTLLSMASILNMDYIPNLIKVDRDSDDRMLLSRLMHDNRVFKFLKQRGYAIMAFSSGYAFTEFTETDYYIKPDDSLTEFENVLFTTTFLAQSQTDEDSLFYRHRKRVLFTLDGLTKIKRTEKPLFIIAHIVSPHPPFIFTAEGAHQERDWEFNFFDCSHYVYMGGKEAYLKGYAEQVTYITKLLEQTISKILARYPVNPPVIVIQADHGPGSGLDWYGIENSDVGERLSVLSAVLLPNKDYSEFKNNYSPVNIFRFILNSYFNTEYELLEHRSYYTSWPQPYNFYDITDELAALVQKWNTSKAPYSQ